MNPLLAAHRHTFNNRAELEASALCGCCSCLKVFPPDDIVAWARAQGGKLNYSSLGNGSSAHLTMELFMSEAGFQATHVPYNGSPPAASLPSRR